ncbi:MAG TPA: hypothetical protein VJ063_11490 [Verrucomicrobiae bacterium]|nr:hypothetical protein [Verrucomicrobiae bacterium]
MFRLQRFGLIAICLGVASCATRLERPSGERNITEGVTTYEQVVKAFGRPAAETRNSNGKRLVSYYQTRARRSFDSVMFGRLAKNQGQVELRHLDIVFSPQKIVEHYHYFESAEQVRSRFSHIEIGTAVDDAKLGRLKKGSTTRTELLEMLGPPVMEGLNFDGQIVLSWLYARIASINSRDMQILSAILDKNGNVQDYKVNQRVR